MAPSSVSARGLTFDVQADNGDVKEGLVPYQLQRLQLAEKIEHAPGTKLMVEQADGALVDATVHRTGGKERATGTTDHRRAEVVFDLNEYNSVLPLSVDAYNAARGLLSMRSNGQMVEDAIWCGRPNRPPFHTHHSCDPMFHAHVCAIGTRPTAFPSLEPDRHALLQARRWTSRSSCSSLRSKRDEKIVEPRQAPG